MDRDKFGQKGHAYRHGDLTIEENSMHPDYEVELGDPETSATGRMVIFKLRPKAGSGPRFEGRWDDKQEELDVDVFDVADEENKKFTAKDGEKKRYLGHHNGKAVLAPSGRTYPVKIEWPGLGTIFEGKANFKIHRVLPAGMDPRPKN